MAMILVALGANLPSRRYGPPLLTLTNALTLLSLRGLAPVCCSRWFKSPPWPPSGQPDYLNGVARFDTLLGPAAVMTLLHAVEEEFGRRRRHPNQARSLDLDLIDHGGRVSPPGAWPRLPHPRASARAFVLKPLAEVAPDWRDPRDGRSCHALLAALPRADRESVRPLA